MRITTVIASLSVMIALSSTPRCVADDAAQEEVPKETARDVADPFVAAAPIAVERDMKGQVAKSYGISRDRAVLLMESQAVLSGRLAKLLISDEGVKEIKLMLANAMNRVDSNAPPRTLAAHEMQGRHLPSEFVRFLPGTGPDLGGCHTLRNTASSGMPGDYAFDVSLLLDFVARIVRERPSAIAELALGRSGRVPPTLADYMLYNSILAETVDRGCFAAEDMSGWRALARGDNPVYRLLILRILRFAQLDEKERLGIYAGFVNETDPTIRRVAVRELGWLRASDAIAVLEAFREQAGRAGDNQLEQDAMKWIERSRVEK